MSKPKAMAPNDPAWLKLSPRGREIAQQIAIRFAAGYAGNEVAEMLNAAPLGATREPAEM